MNGPFLTTRWTRVVAARGETPEAKQALSDLCAAYYEPVISYLRSAGQNPDEARDLAHEFFAAILDRHGLSGADPQRGRFRTYLLGAVKHFLANKRAADHRAKRGGEAIHESLEERAEACSALEVADAAASVPDVTFDREWAVHLLDRALDLLAAEADAAGQSQTFDELKPWLTGDRPDRTQADAARKLGLTDGAVRVAVHRLRRRFRELVKAEIRQTVNRTEEVDEELRHLINILGAA